MDLWMLHSFLLLVLLRGVDGELPRVRRQSWRDRFQPIESFWDLHEKTNQKGRTSPKPGTFYLLAPDLLRADSPENIYLEADGVSSPVTVSISIQDFSKTVTLLQDFAILSEGNGYHILKSIQLPSDTLNREEKENKFVYLRVDFQGLHVIERVMMVTFHSGYIFIQTDKPIYNPGDTIRFRVFVSSPSFKAFDSSVTIDIENSDGVVVKQFSRTRAVGGVYKDTFPLSDIVKEGMWKVIAKFDHWQQNTFTSNFVVKKYVLPAFNVTLTPTKSFLSLDDAALHVKISANYLYREAVQGTAYVVFGVKINNQMRRFPSVKQVSDLDEGMVSLTMEEIKSVYPDVTSLVGQSVYVKASVLTATGSDLVEAEKTGIKIVQSPYVLSFKDIPQFFKPDMPFDFTIQVSHHDGSPAKNVPVKVNMMDSPLIIYGSSRVTVNMPKAQASQTIIAETTQADLRPEQQARHEDTVQMYQSANRHQQKYLYISTGTNRVSVGETLPLRLSIYTQEETQRELVKHITYLVVNKGKIIKAEHVDVAGQLVTSVGLAITSEMLPSFHFVAFYHIWTDREEVVSDSIWVDVVDSCVGKLNIDGERREYIPGKTLRFQVRGDPGAKVSMVAVDNAVFLLNKERLTQKKLWDVVEHGDFSCSRRGGRDVKAVFTNAGLLFHSSAGTKTETRQVLKCAGSTRRRRSAEQLRRKAELEEHYREKLQRRCCKDGLREIPMPYSCTRRSLYITEGWECMRAFRYCCATFRSQEFNTEIPTTPPPITTAAPTTPPPRPTVPIMAFGRRGSGRKIALSRHSFDWGNTRTVSVAAVDRTYTSVNKMSVREEVPEPVMRVNAASEPVLDDDFEDEDEDWEYLDESQVYLRFRFYESWWMEVDLPNEVDKDGLAVRTVNEPLPDSITEWGVLAVSSSPHTGFCVAEPFNVIARKDFFVDLRLPHSVARNEQLEIRAVVHNYGYEALTVRVVLMKTEGICSIAFKDRHTQELTVAAGASVAVPYTIVPLVVGKLPLEVMLVTKDRGGDRIQKLLRVVMDGVQKTKVWSAMLDPSAEGGTQILRVAKVALKSVVPNSVPETFLNVRGNVLADSIDNSISKDSLASLIRMPGGCVEQNLASITMPLIATLYLERTRGWESVGVQRKAEALGYIQRGYSNQLAYRRADGSYPPYRKQGASTWITAYVVKVFSMAHSLIGINEKEVCDPLLYLLKNKHNNLKGTFREDNPVYDTTMTGGVRGDDPEITLTAFVLIALAEADQAGILCEDPDFDTKEVIRKTAEYLRKALEKSGRRPYTVAIASYALALLGKTTRHVLTNGLLRASQGGRWHDKQNHYFSLEATGYALLALVKLEQMDEAALAFKWLNSQRRRGGGYGSTQSTMVVLQALSEYLIHRPPANDLALNVDIRLAGRKEIRYHFDPATAYVARTSRLPPNLDLEVEARGNGQGILEVVTYYNQLHEVDEQTPCKDFELNVTIEESSEKPPADVEKYFQLSVRVRALGPRDVRMVVLDISLPTGFTPENSDLEMLSNSVDRYISNFQIVDNLSDRGSLILHLFKVSHKEPEILIFRLQQTFKVGLLQPSSVTAYEYYNPDHRCSRTYSPRENIEELKQICRDDVCRCTQGDCCVSKTASEDFPNNERELFACKSLHHVFQVKVLSVEQSYYDKYELEITRVIKLGVEAGVEVGQRRFFMSHGGCRENLDLVEGSQYLIMGPKEDQWNIDGGTSRYNYMLGKDTWVERWPSPAECSSDPSLQAKCQSLDNAVSELSVNGCQV
ncbi:venom factor-like [Halichoeres trimaculatus]|uniref:venom factor-like n=1 Tax=Halichoeres trimaculatus TaxID=147232 RepID=UPI003D9E73DA